MNDSKKSKTQLMRELKETRQELEGLKGSTSTSSKETLSQISYAERFQTVFEESPLGIISFDLKLQVTEVNPKLSEMLGYSPEEFQSMNFVDFTHPDDLDNNIQLTRKLIDGEISSYRIEKRYIKKDGDIIWVVLTAVVSPKEITKESRYLIGMIEDISERKNAVQATEKLNEQLEQRVYERTLDLVSLNTQLRQEIREREKAEKAENKQRILAETLMKTASQMNMSLDFEEVLDLILENVRQVIEHETANIMLIEDGIARIVRTHGYEERGFDHEHLKNTVYFRLDETENLHEVVVTGKPFIIPNVADYPQWVHNVYTEWIRSHVAMPIRLKDKTLGFLNLDSAIPFFFTEDKVEDLQAFADQTAIAIQNARLFQNVEETASELARSNEALQKEIEERKQVEIALRKSEARYRSLVENNLDYIILIDKDYQIQSINFVAPTLKKEEVIGSNALDYVPTEYLEEAEAAFIAVLEGQPFAHYIVPTTCRDGTAGWFDVRVMPIYEDEQISGLTLAMADISEFRQAQAEIKYIYDSTSIMLGMATLDGYFEAINPAWSKILGYTEGELLEKHSTEIVHPDDHSILLQASRKLRKGYPFINKETRFLTKDGKYKWILWNATIEDETIFFSAQDISSRKAMEGELHISEAKYRMILENMQEGYYETDLSGNFTFCNQALSERLGYSQEELLNMNYRELYTNARIRKQVFTAFNQVYQKANAVDSLESQIMHKDGNERSIELSIALIHDNSGKAIGFRGITRDITERKEAEWALQAALDKEKELNALKESFMTMASHEFRTPITVISNSSQMLQRYFDRLSAEQRDKHLSKIIAQVDHLKDMIDNIMTVIRTSHDPLSFTPQQMRLDLFCEEIIENFRHSLTTDHSFIFTLPQVPVEIWGDSKLIRIVISHLLSNAIKYSAKGSEIRLEITQDTTDCKLRIIDEGIGMSTKELEHLFEAYYRADETGHIKGIGLGLRIVQEFITLHKGRIDVISEPNKGTIFTISLPTSPA